MAHGALSPDEIEHILEGIAADTDANPELWQISEARRNGVGAPSVGADAPELLRRTDALDSCAYHPSITPLVRRLVGPGALLSGFTYVDRHPCSIPPPADLNEGDARCLTRQWHREDSGNISGAAQNEFFAPAVQVIYYLDAVDEENRERSHPSSGCSLLTSSHLSCTCVADCFSVIPESAETKRRLPTEARETGLRIDDYGSFGQAASESQGSYLHPTKPEWVDAYGRTLARRVGGVDVLAAAGAAVILNNVRASLTCQQ